MTEVPAELLAALRSMRLLGQGSAPGEPLAGGVSSDIWRIDLPSGPICMKRALPKLRVAADWTAPVERSGFEARWMREAGRAAPGSAPEILGEADGCVAMTWLPPDRHRLWKTELAHGHVEPPFAAEVGERLARIHAASTSRPALASQFQSGHIFHAIRLEPYLLATARAHPDRTEALVALVASHLAHGCAMIHGDVSPKNILVGPDGPVFLDAECATWGDPAFDLAFCLNHLLLKCCWVPTARGRLLEAYAALGSAYLAGVHWEPRRLLEPRAARLLPGLLLARVDGKSPVEYITADTDRAMVRGVGRALLDRPPAKLTDIAAAWERALP